MPPHDPSDAPAPFPTTAWARIQVVQDRGHPDHVPELNRFVALYWKPVFYFLRTRGLPFQEAQDATQDFFLRLQEQDVVARADPGRGRFRSFLLGVLKRVLADRGRRDRRRRSGVSIESLIGDEERSLRAGDGRDAGGGLRAALGRRRVAANSSRTAAELPGREPAGVVHGLPRLPPRRGQTAQSASRGRTIWSIPRSGPRDPCEGGETAGTVAAGRVSRRGGQRAGPCLRDRPVEATPRTPGRCPGGWGRLSLNTGNGWRNDSPQAVPGRDGPDPRGRIRFAAGLK